MLRVANCSGFYGDRLAAAREMVDGGPIDVLTGDYLAELTMAILWRTKSKHPGGGYARTFLRQMEDVLADCHRLGIRVVSNAGGLAPAALADEIRSLAMDSGLDMIIAHITGDDLIDRLDELNEISGTPLTANAYLGGWGIAAAISQGAEVVVTGRVTDAALVMGPGAAHFGWEVDDWDCLAGALVAGHVVECGTQVTGGNFSFFSEIPGIEHLGFPIVELDEDGSFVVTKHPGSGGAVTIETVTAQLLYEISGPRYLNPDVTARFDTIRLTQDGPDRIRVDGVRGEPPPPTLKVATNRLGGYRNSVTFVLTGLDIAEKAATAERTLWVSVGGREQFEDVGVHLLGVETEDPATNDEALAFLQITVEDPDPAKVGRSFSAAAVEQALAGYPGFHLTAPPGDASPFAVFGADSIPAASVPQTVHIGDGSRDVVSPTHEGFDVNPPAEEVARHDLDGPVRQAPLGLLVGARSGDKGGDANVGLWVRRSSSWPWFRAVATEEWLRSVLPEAAALTVDRYVFDNLRAVNFVVHGLLGEGVAASTRPDAQAKGLGEYLRAKWVDIPVGLLEGPMKTQT